MAKKLKNREIEVRFLEVDVKKLQKKLLSLGAKDHGRHLLTAKIFYDKELTWRDKKKQLVRLRYGNGKNTLTFKNWSDSSATGTKEIEILVSNPEKTEDFLNHIGLRLFRFQEKWRHTFTLKDMSFEFDTWPKVPTFMEIEAPSLAKLKRAAKMLDLDWKKSVSGNVAEMVDRIYKIPMPKLNIFTFKKIK